MVSKIPLAGFSKQDLIDRKGALIEEYNDLANRESDVFREIKLIEKLLKDV